MAHSPPLMAVLPLERHLRQRDDQPSAGATVLAIKVRPIHPARETRADSQAHAGEGVTEQLHGEILRKLPEDFIRRMRNWARSIDGSSVGTCSKLWDSIGDGRFESRLPILMGEAEDTERALRAIPQRYQEAVAVFWSYESRTIAWMAKATPRLRLWKLGPTSFTEWLERGHDMLQHELGRQRAAHGERARKAREAGSC